ncbi:MAG: hypothetical protein NXI10_13005 [bacterium]|nr:hypothetical protein [bacterium]
MKIRYTLALFLVLSGWYLSAQTFESVAYYPVSSVDQFNGIWIVKDTNEYINPLCREEEEYCDMTPGGDKLIFSEESNYFTSYIDPEWGAVINLQFTYERKDGHFECIMIGTNAMGYWMEHEHETFSFDLFYSDERNELMFIRQDGVEHILIPATEEDLK